MPRAELRPGQTEGDAVIRMNRGATATREV
jgi:hypothetical protein